MFEGFSSELADSISSLSSRYVFDISYCFHWNRTSLLLFFKTNALASASLWGVRCSLRNGTGSEPKWAKATGKIWENRQALTASRQRCQYVAPCSRSKCRHRDGALFKNFHLSVNEVHSYSFIKCQCQHAVPAVSGAFTSKASVLAFVELWLASALALL